MKIIIDNRPAKSGWTDGQSKPFTAIRLKPETNTEMAELEWIKQVGFIPIGFSRDCLDGMSYVITFRTKNEGEKYEDNQ